MIAVAGSNGHTGRAVAEALIAAGTRIRVIVRDKDKGVEWRDRGQDVAVASLDDATALTKALEGVSAAYLLVPPAYAAPDLLAAQRPVVDAIAEAVRRSQIGHAVFLSSVGADKASGTGPVATLRAAEQALKATGRPVTLLRAPFFLENWVPVLSVAVAQGILPSVMALDVPLETASAIDIGREAARLLLGPAPTGVRLVEFGGPTPLTPLQVAAALSGPAGHPVKAVQVPFDQVAPGMKAAGFSDDSIRLFGEMYEGIASRRFDYERASSPDARGTLTPAAALGPFMART